MSAIKGVFHPLNLQSADSMPDWKVVRLEFVETETETVDKMEPGFLVKIDNVDGVDKAAPGLEADDAELDGIIIEAPTDVANPDDKTVAVALMGSFNKNAVHYADAHSAEGPPPPISAAGEARLRDIGIFLDAAITAGPFAP